ncbi:hypothetical protein C8K44_1408 [Aminobacter sp. AP02]|nr:hypothetical protein C8K44_1408 [Aminobacter sp. AP02]
MFTASGMPTENRGKTLETASRWAKLEFGMSVNTTKK